MREKETVKKARGYGLPHASSHGLDNPQELSHIICHELELVKTVESGPIMNLKPEMHNQRRSFVKLYLYLLLEDFGAPSKCAYKWLFLGTIESFWGLKVENVQLICTIQNLWILTPKFVKVTRQNLPHCVEVFWYFPHINTFGCVWSMKWWTNWPVNLV